MAPFRHPRPADDARSESSSTAFNPKEKNAGVTPAGSGSGGAGGVSKQKKATAAVSASTAKKLATVSTAAAAAAAAASAAAAAAAAAAAPTPTALATEIDPAAPRIDWTGVSVTILHTYRTAYRLPTQASHTHPHADLIYKSSRTALRSPSAVLARQKLRDLKHQRRQAARQSTLPLNKSRSSRGADKDKDTDSSSNSDNLLRPYANNHADGTSTNPSDNNPSASPADSTPTDQSAPPQPIILPEYIGKQQPTSLATAVRKHFNAQQLNEAAVVSRFSYIAKQARGDHAAAIRTDGSAGDGDGCWMGSHGREIRRGRGGDAGFRLRFHP